MEEKYRPLHVQLVFINNVQDPIYVYENACTLYRQVHDLV